MKTCVSCTIFVWFARLAAPKQGFCHRNTWRNIYIDRLVTATQ